MKIWKHFYKNLCSKLVWKELMIKQTKNNVPCTFAIEEYNGEETVGKCYKKELQNTNKIGLQNTNKIGYGTEKVIKRKGDKLHVE